MKKRLLTSSFDELMKNHYGGPGSEVAVSIMSNAEQLFANYYGGSAARKGQNGEEFEEYVVQQSLPGEAFEEYVMGESNLSLESSASEKLQAIPAEDPNP